MRITKKALLQLYETEKKSVKEVGLIIGKSPTTVSRYLKKFGIKARPFSTKGLKTWLGKKHSQATKQKIREARLGKPLSPEHRAKVIKTLSSYRDQTGKKNPSWKGGKLHNREGYVWIKMPNHPNAYKSGYIPEHRLVMSQKIGRPLKKYEHVHHLNGIKDDNRPENLELINGATHNLITRLESRVKELEKEIRLLKIRQV